VTSADAKCRAVPPENKSEVAELAEAAGVHRHTARKALREAEAKANLSRNVSLTVSVELPSDLSRNPRGVKTWSRLAAISTAFPLAPI